MAALRPIDDPLSNDCLLIIRKKFRSRFDILEINARPNLAYSAQADDALSQRHKSSALLQLTLDSGRPALEGVIDQLHALIQRTRLADASLFELPDHCDGVYDRTLDDADGIDGTDTTPTAPQPSSPPRRAATAGATALGGGAAVPPSRSIVVLGAGLCAGPAVEMLSRRGSDVVHVVSAIAGEADRLCAAYTGRTNLVPHTLDAAAGGADWPTLSALLGEADAALSLLPATMHTPIAAQCIRARTPLVTASYVAPELSALDSEASRAEVPILCEMGLDPGLDHMSAAALIASVHAEGGRVRRFSSVCGGLPAPENAFSDANPFGYKFSWSPAGVLAATRNGARWQAEGRVVEVAPNELLSSASPLEGGPLARAFSLEVLPNRDALPYAQLYSLHEEASSFFRGTLRYRGWSALMHSLASLGLTAIDQPLPPSATSWPQLLAHLNVPSDVAGAPPSARGAVEALQWLGAYDARTPLPRASHAGPSVADAFCGLLEARLGYGEGERDAVLMEHQLHVEYSDGRSPATLYSSLVDYGDSGGGASAMARSVGCTAAVGVGRVLASPSDATPALSGVLRPTERAVWEYCLPKLSAEGIHFREAVERE